MKHTHTQTFQFINIHRFSIEAWDHRAAKLMHHSTFKGLPTLVGSTASETGRGVVGGVEGCRKRIIAAEDETLSIIEGQQTREEQVAWAWDIHVHKLVKKRVELLY